MRNTKKKGFTIVELVIVIAVIAILAGVLFPTFAGVVENAKKSAAMQEARNIYTDYIAQHHESIDACYTITVDSYTFQVHKGQFNSEAGATHESGCSPTTLPTT